MTILRAVGLATAITVAAFECAAQSLSADLTNHLVGITTGFTGTDVVLFGAVESPGDVYVVVTGPPETVTVRRKARIAGIWINRDRVDFPQVPSFYAVATSRLAGAPPDPGRPERLQIGLSRLRLDPATSLPAKELEQYRSALIRSKQREGLFGVGAVPVVFLGQHLFRTNIRFPANVPTGVYGVQVFLVRDDEIVDAQTTPLVVSKVGFSAEVSEFARVWPIGYGLIAVIGAIAAGWGAAAVFRRV